MDRCDAKELLKSHKMKVTKQRLQLMDEIISKQTIFTANDLYKKFSNNMDLVTVYRILNLFQEKKLIREILGTNDSKNYELACIHNPVHPHFSCRICGALYCLNAVSKQALLNLEQYCSEFVVEDISLNFSGICNKCS